MFKSRFGWLLGLTICCSLMLPGYTVSKASAAEKTKAAASLPHKAAQVVNYDSPQAVFDAAKKAEASEDWKVFCQCLTPESQEAFSVETALDAVFLRSVVVGLSGLLFAGEKEAEREFAKVSEVLGKHGFDEKTLKGIEEDSKSPEEEVAAIGRKIKDKPAFISDMFAALSAMNGSEVIPLLVGSAKLVGLNIDGDAATATVVQTIKGKDLKDRIAFKKVDSSWLIDMPEWFETSSDEPRSGGQLTGSPKELPGTSSDDAKK